MEVREKQAIELAGALRVSGDIAEGLEKLRDEATRTASERRGGKMALRFHVSKLASVHAAADAELESGAFDGLSALQVCSLVKLYVTRAGDAATNLSKQQEAEELAQGGKVAAFGAACLLAGRYHTVSKSRYDQVTTPLEEIPPEEEDKRRKPGAGRTLAQAKAATAADAAPKQAKKTTKKVAKKATKKA